MVAEMRSNGVAIAKNGQEKHLDSLEIVGFRAFKHLKIERLGGVNLIVGKNSVGKTCLLEAIRLYAERGSPRMLWQLLAERDEEAEIGWGSSKSENKDDTLPFLQIQPLFYGRRSLEEIEQKIQIGLLSSHSDLLQIQVGLFDEGSKSSELHSFSDFRQPATNGKDKFRATFPAISIQFNNEDGQILPLEKSDFYRLSTVRLGKRKSLTKTPSIFVGTHGLSLSEIDKYWDQIKLRDTKKIVLHALRIIKPEIEDIDIFSISERSIDRIVQVRAANHEELLPLRSLGDGLNRIFGLIVALVNARDGLLLVDEIENGLHYTAQRDLWRLIFQTARQLNAQVFATTHSWDCIDAFQKAAVEDENEEGLLIRLQRKGDEIQSVLFNEEDLVIVTREQIEIR